LRLPEENLARRLTIGTSRAKVERARTVLADLEEAIAVREGKKTIHQAALDAKAKRVPLSGRRSTGSNGGPPI
jgi:hypothetical protein